MFTNSFRCSSCDIKLRAIKYLGTVFNPAKINIPPEGGKGLVNQQTIYFNEFVTFTLRSHTNLIPHLYSSVRFFFNKCI